MSDVYMYDVGHYNPRWQCYHPCKNLTPGLQSSLVILNEFDIEVGRYLQQ